MSSAPASAKPIAIATDPSLGVNLVGFLEGERGQGEGTRLGLGDVARKLESGLEKAGIPFSAIAYRPIAGPHERTRELGTSEEAPYDTNIICLNADYLHTFMEDVGVSFFAGHRSIGVWFWETDVFREESREGFRFVDEVWVASEYVRRAVAAEADIPVLVVPLPIEEPAQPVLSRSDLGLPPGFMFLFSFNFVSAQRKNATAVVEAFKQAFAPGEGPTLLVKSVNGRERKPQWLEELRRAAAGRPDVHILDGYVSMDEKDALMAACDCYVSLHRSEGFGLTMAEAMSRGKPVIATNYSGNLAFMDETNSHLVPYRLIPIPADWWAYSPGARWAEPDVEAAAELMRRVYEAQDEARALGERGRDDILSRLSLERTADFIAGRLAETRERRAFTGWGSNDDPKGPILEASRVLVKGIGGSLAQRSARGGLASFVRRLLVRALWPQLADQHRFNASVLDALTRLRISVDELRGEVVRLGTRSRPSEEPRENETVARSAETEATASSSPRS